MFLKYAPLAVLHYNYVFLVMSISFGVNCYHNLSV